MAEETKRKPGRPKKVVETPKVEPNNDDIIKALMEQIKQQNERMAELQAQIDNARVQTTPIQPQQDEYTTKKIKVVNLLNYPLNLSTEGRGKGKKFSFAKRGDSRLIKYDDLCEILTSCPKFIKNGYCYIADAKAIEMLDLEEEYKNIVPPEVMEQIPYLREEYLVDIFISLNRTVQDSYATEIAKNINKGYKIDLNYIGRINDEVGIDIQEIARDLKDLERKPE